jgi:putative tricarboxylic transport membrane protein
MDVLQSLANGFGVTLRTCTWLSSGVSGDGRRRLPGIGPWRGLCTSRLRWLDATGAIIMLAGIYYGAMYGGSTTSILMNIPGESASVITCLDGYQMARKGRGGAALFIAAFGSWAGGTLGIIGLMLMAPLLADFATKFGPPEMFSIYLLAFILLLWGDFFTTMPWSF